MNNLVLFDQPTYDKLLAEVPKYKMITPSILSDRLRLNGSLARAGGAGSGLILVAELIYCTPRMQQRNVTESLVCDRAQLLPLDCCAGDMLFGQHFWLQAM